MPKKANSLDFVENNYKKFSFAQIGAQIEMMESGYSIDESIVDLILAKLSMPAKPIIRTLEISNGAGLFTFKLLQTLKTNTGRIHAVILFDTQAKLDACRLLYSKKVPQSSLYQVDFILGDFLQLSSKSNTDILFGLPMIGKVSVSKKIRLQYPDVLTGKSYGACVLQKAVTVANTTALLIPESMLSNKNFSDSIPITAQHYLTHQIHCGKSAVSGLDIDLVAMLIDKSNIVAQAQMIRLQEK